MDCLCEADKSLLTIRWRHILPSGLVRTTSRRLSMCPIEL